MTGVGEDAPLPTTVSGGEFLLSLLKNPQPNHHHHQQSQLLSGVTAVTIPQQQPLQQQPVAIDPAVAAVGPTLPFPPSWPSNGRDVPSPWPHTSSPLLAPNFLGFPQTPWSLPGNQFAGSQGALVDDLRRLGFSGLGNNNDHAIQNVIQQKHQEQKLVFGSLPSNMQILQQTGGLLNANLLENSKLNLSNQQFNSIGNNNRHVIQNVIQQKHQEQKLVFGSFPSDTETLQKPGGLLNGNLLEKSKLNLSNQQFNSPLDSNTNSSTYAIQNRNSGEGGKQQQHGGNYRHGSSAETPRPLPGFPGKPRGGSRDFGNRRHVQHDVDKVKAEYGQFSSDNKMRLRGQLDQPGLLAGSNLQSVSATVIEESLLGLHTDVGRDGFSRRGKFRRGDGGEVDEVGEQLLESLLIEDQSDNKNDKKQHHRQKESRVDNRGQRLLSRRMRMLKRRMEHRSDIHRLNVPLLAICESLIPPEEERAKQKQLLALLEKLVCKEWPEAQLNLYGSCANSFGVSKSDIDVCLAFKEKDINKSEILLKLADILQSDNLQNVQALTHARVPIVKLMDPATGISCDIGMNNVLAVENTKLLRDYAKIDARLQQLAFIVKHWAKSRGVNDTYQGTLSSYAYVLMCIHFLQQRRPAILPCLQGMEKTYSVTVDDVECAYCDQVEKLCNFGSCNKETVGQLVWAFFNYWAYGHDYTNSVISVRTGRIISKQEKDWTRRIGNERHLICIEDPFEISHDLGRVVDKFSIRVLREEFERAADILQYDPNPCVTLFEPYVPC